MTDIELIDTGSGGDGIFTGNDFVTIDGLQNMIYIGLFGGNLESNTKDFLESEQRFDWWGNGLLLSENESAQFNSDTERLLRDVALTTSTRVQIEETVKSDLQFMTDFATIEVLVIFVNDDRIEINIKIIEPDNIEDKDFVFIWDATEKELINKA